MVVGDQVGHPAIVVPVGVPASPGVEDVVDHFGADLDLIGLGARGQPGHQKGAPQKAQQHFSHVSFLH
jgi:hypothetical protein